MARNEFFVFGLALVEQIVAMVAGIEGARQQFAGLQRHVQLQMGHVTADFAGGFDRVVRMQRCTQGALLTLANCS